MGGRQARRGSIDGAKAGAEEPTSFLATLSLLGDALLIAAHEIEDVEGPLVDV